MMEKEICIREVNENLRRVRMGQELTRPLAQLNRVCEFRKKYDEAFDIWEEERIKEEVKAKKKEYYQKPEVKARMKEYDQKPEVKAKRREYHQKPENKAKQREYYQKPEVKAKKKEYYQRKKEED